MNNKHTPLTALVCIDFRAKTCTRYAGKTRTDIFEVETEITAGKVEAIRTNPSGTGTIIPAPPSGRAA